jgi:hypothetical protein
MHVADFYTYCASLGVTYPDYRASCKQAELQPVDQRVYAMQYNRWRAISTVCKEIERVVREFEFGRHFLMRIEPRDIANKLFLDDSFCESEFAALLN